MSEQTSKATPKQMVQGVVVLVLAVFAVRFFACDSETKEKPAAKKKAVAKAEPKRVLPLSKEAFAQAVASAAAPELGFDRQVIERAEVTVEEFLPESVSMRIAYPEAENITTLSSRMHTKVIAGAAVKSLMEAGWNPRTESTLVWVFANKAAPKSVTGGDMVIPLGNAKYSPNDDKITFDDP